jgi:hypothetical protein
MNLIPNVTILSNTERYDGLLGRVRLEPRVNLDTSKVESVDAGDLEPQLTAYAVANQDKSQTEILLPLL